MTSTAAALGSSARDQCLRYRLDVIARDVAGLVHSAGGWLYQRAATGWDVRVLVPAHLDLRPLQILGLTADDLEAHLAAPECEPPGHALAVAADALRADARIHQRVQQALRCSLTELVVWGRPATLELDRRLRTVQHTPSVAGRAFKRRALAAAGGEVARIDGPERFRSDQSHCLPVTSDLVSVG
ncbi:hypothetical protein [Mycolicibacter hiberniae]|uniref:Uncharacterized protein n=1 Tax=Mycolicibacter hiberniae TaxID=29314 RepID=A0A7I7X5X0_9MYCO|nr:hypothetical protein [Mycolicibacter hiberniae]MCV7087506.1 hypothetical protein [Mycolicibacter hiberniae]ORV69137.1 hypothetical protein AWC09_13950 [Mycolicibacter hiberniae]BBZ24974.1 hypothetical protein MHIB_33920 [Mycolicibacter hiberniae]